MTPERWQQIEQIFHDAMEHPPEQRERWIEFVCAGDDALRREVEVLLSANQQMGSFLAEGAIERELPNAASRQSAASNIDAGEQFGHYRILSKLGAGGMGEVWLAFDINLERQVALKVLPARFTQDVMPVKRFEREAKAVSALNHPNIITIYEVGKIEASFGKTHFIATEYIEGETLRKRIADGILELPEILAIAVQVASALRAAHRAGIVHRDIKPENAMLRPDGLVKVLDFGLAKLVQPSRPEVDSAAPTIGMMMKTEIGAVLGTVSYMSPEQARGLEVDARSDIFSFGIMLYEMVCGVRPFTGQTGNDVIASILKTDPPPLEGVHDELQRIITKALQKEPDARYQSAEGIEQDLKDLKRLLESGALAMVSSLRTNRTDHSGSTARFSTSSVGLPVAQSTPWFKHRAVLALLLAGLIGIIAAIAYFSTRLQEIDSIAVMPLEHASGDAELEYLADGLTESLINDLSQLPKLRVLSRNAVFRYKGKNLDIEQVASQLKARAVVTGRIVRRGDRLDISLELEDVRDHRHIWGEHYNKSLNELLAMQSTVARAISVNLRSQLSDAQTNQVAKRHTGNDHAYRLYLQGLFQQNKSTEEGLNTSIKYFQQAIDADENYALAHAALAHSYILIASVYQPAETVIPLARQRARRAVELDETLADGHAALAAIAYSHDWNWTETERESRRALELNPNHALAYNELGNLSLALGRTQDAIAAFQRQLELDPNSLQAHHRLARAYSFARQFDLAVVTFRNSLKLEPNYPLTYVSIAQIYGFQRKYTEAFAELDRAAALAKEDADNANNLSVRAQVYARMGRTAEARQLLSELLAYPKFVRPHIIALVYAALGENDNAFDWLEKAAQGRAPYLASLKINPGFDSLHSDPRFQSLLNRLNHQAVERKP